MTDKSKDALLLFGKMLALFLQGLFALGGAIALSLIPFVLLLNQGFFTGFVDPEKNILARFPVPGVGVALLMSVSLAALFMFFGKMRAIIGSVGEGDPFIPENAWRLNAMAWLLLVHEVATVLVGLLRIYLANLAEGTEERITVSLYDLDGLLMVLILFILARVFRHGAAMREDLEGTV
jgi:hypothetical protein